MRIREKIYKEYYEEIIYSHSALTHLRALILFWLTFR